MLFGPRITDVIPDDAYVRSILESLGWPSSRYRKLINSITSSYAKSTCHFTGNNLVRVHSQQSECLRLQGRRLDHRWELLPIVLGQCDVVPHERSQVLEQDPKLPNAHAGYPDISF